MRETRRILVDLEEGWPVDAPPADQEWGARHVWLHDPTGYRVSLYTSVAR